MRMSNVEPCLCGLIDNKSSKLNRKITLLIIALQNDIYKYRYQQQHDQDNVI